MINNSRLFRKAYTFYSKFSLSEKHLFRGTLWNILGNGVGKISILVATIFVAKILGPDIFGQWGVIRSTSALFSILLGFGVGVTAIKYVAEYKDSFKSKAGSIIGLTIALALIIGALCASFLFFSSEFISTTILKESNLTNPIRLSSILLLFIALNSVLSGCLAGMNSFSSIALSNFIGGVFGTVIIIYLSDNHGLMGLVIGYVLYYCITSISLTVFFIRKLHEYSIKVTIDNYREQLSVILNHNIPAILSGGIGGAVVWGVFAYVSRMHTGFSIIGINNAAKIAQNALMEVAAQVDVPIISYLSSAKKDKRSSKINLFTPLIIGFIFILPIVYIPEFLSMFFRDSAFFNAEFSLIVSLTMLTTYIMVYKRGMGRSIITLNLMWWGVYENLFWAALLVLFTYLFVSDLGSVGFALAFAMSYGIDLLVIKPIYYKKGIISKVLTYSWEMITLWISILIAPVLILYSVGLNYRIIVLFVVMTVQYFCLRGIYKKL